MPFEAQGPSVSVSVLPLYHKCNPVLSQALCTRPCLATLYTFDCWMFDCGPCGKCCMFSSVVLKNGLQCPVQVPEFYQYPFSSFIDTDGWQRCEEKVMVTLWFVAFYFSDFVYCVWLQKVIWTVRPLVTGLSARLEGGRLLNGWVGLNTGLSRKNSPLDEAGKSTLFLIAESSVGVGSCRPLTMWADSVIFPVKFHRSCDATDTSSL